MVYSTKIIVFKEAFATLHIINDSKINCITKQLEDGLSVPRPFGKGQHAIRPKRIGVERLQNVIDHIKLFPSKSSHYSRYKN